MKGLVVMAAIACFMGISVHAEPILDELKVRFHAIEVNASASTVDPVCMACHVPKISQKHQEIEQLWYEQLPKMELTIKGLEHPEPDKEPDPFSKACLSCHDGNMASMVANAPLSPCGLPSNTPVSATGANHPVFMKYPAGKKDLENPAAPLRGEWSGANKVEDLLREEKMVCVSCHVPHHSQETGYLRTTMAGSKLCIGCHKK